MLSTGRRLLASLFAVGCVVAALPTRGPRGRLHDRDRPGPDGPDSLPYGYVVEWEIAMWYAPDLGLFVKGVDHTFGLVSFELDRAVNAATLRRGAAVPPPATVPPLDHRARHREAAGTLACGWRCPP